jgi:plasmid replication initiation protein
MPEKNKNKITQYKNEVNGIPMRNWTAEEMNVFFAILTQMKDRKLEEIVFDKYQLQELIDYTGEHDKRFSETMQALGKKIQSLTYYESTSNSFLMMPLFLLFKSEWKTDLSDVKLTVAVNPKFEYILNGWKENHWTKFMYDEFLKIESTYSKTLFRLLKQWRTKGKREFSIHEFRLLMDIPESYVVGMITKRIVEKSVKDLQPYFSGLKVKIVKSNKQGNPVIAYEFTWEAEQTEEYDPNKFNKPKFKKKNSGVHDYQERKYDEEFYKKLLKGTKDQINYDE